MKMRDADIPELVERQIFIDRFLVIDLLLALSIRHRRMINIFGMRGSPMSEYLKESLNMEREHMAEVIAMIQSMI